MSSPRRAVALLGATSLLTGGLVAATTAPTLANPEGTDLVISEVYGGGGNSGATLTHDFVELYNPTDEPIDASGLTFTYYSSSGTEGPNAHTLECGVVPAGGHFLVQEAAGSGGMSALPAPDATGELALSGTNGSIEVTRGSSVVDLVGYGSATRREGEAAPVLSNTTSASRDDGGSDTDDNATDFAAGEPTPQNDGVDDPCEPEDEPPAEVDATIPEIQGSGASSPLLDDVVTTSGVVTAAYPDGGLFGFYLQVDGSGGELDLGTHTTSEAVFVRQTQPAGPVTVVPGDLVEVTGTVTEFAGQTQVEVGAPEDIAPLPDTPAGVAPVVSAWPGSDSQRESLEGMLFAPQGDFTITDNFGTASFGELVLAEGDTPLIQPTQVARPNSARAVRVAAENAARRIVLDDGSSTGFNSNRDLTPPYISNDQPFRVGATATFTDDVIFTEGGSPSSPTYRMQPLQPVTGPANTESPIVFPDTRSDTPDESLVGAEGSPRVKVASFNVLNYFTTLGDADDDNVGDGGCSAFTDRDGDGNNVSGGCDQRGAWDPEDLDRQQSKIVSAINALDADVVGLMEIENSIALGDAPDEAVETLVAALNDAAGAGTWAANPSSAELPSVDQQDVITNAIIYRTAAVERLGEARALGDQSEGDDTPSDEPFANAREPIAQAFAPTDGSAPFMVVVNHFKSKGSPGPFPGDSDSGDGQGSSNESRTRQAEALVDWVPTVQGDVEDVLLLGDFNSYAQEDPMRILYGAGYANLELESGNDEYSYSFGGQSGSLDHVLGNQAVVERFTGADVWNINAVEPVVMEYSRYNYYATDFHQDGPFRSSDHDPVVVGLGRGTPATTTPAMAVKVRPQRVVARRTKPLVAVRLDADGRRVGGEVRVRSGGVVKTRVLRQEKARVRLPAYRSPGRRQVAVIYLGNDRFARVREVVTIRVRPRR